MKNLSLSNRIYHSLFPLLSAFTFYVVLFLCLFSCEDENSFRGKTPQNQHESSFFPKMRSRSSSDFLNTEKDSVNNIEQSFLLFSTY